MKIYHTKPTALVATSAGLSADIMAALLDIANPLPITIGSGTISFTMTSTSLSSIIVYGDNLPSTLTLTGYASPITVDTIKIYGTKYKAIFDSLPTSNLTSFSLSVGTNSIVNSIGVFKNVTNLNRRPQKGYTITNVDPSTQLTFPNGKLVKIQTGFRYDEISLNFTGVQDLDSVHQMVSLLNVEPTVGIDLLTGLGQFWLVMQKSDSVGYNMRQVGIAETAIVLKETC